MLRQTRSVFVQALFVWSLFILPAAAQPANDNFANAQEIVVDQPLPITVTGNTAGATVETEETALDPTLAASVWFKLTAPVDGVVQIDTQGSNFAIRLAVAVGSSYATLTLIAADNEPTNGTAVIFEVEQGVEYHIAVFGFEGQTGNLSLNLKETEGASISGHVTAASGGAPLGQITVQALAYNNVFARWTVVAQTKTHDLGGYTLGNLQTGTNYRLRAIDPSGDHAPVCYTTATFVEDGQTVVPNSDLFGIDMAMPNTATISGVVRDSGATGLGDITARAYIWNTTAGEWELASSTTSASDGSFTLTGLPAGTVRMGFEDETTHLHLPSFYDGSSDLASAQDIAVTGGASLSGYVITLQTSGSIQGTATQRFTNLPLPGIRVQALRFNSSNNEWELTGSGAITSGNGSYTLRACPTTPTRWSLRTLNPARSPPCCLVEVRIRTPPRRWFSPRVLRRSQASTSLSNEYASRTSVRVPADSLPSIFSAIVLRSTLPKPVPISWTGHRKACLLLPTSE